MISIFDAKFYQDENLIKRVPESTKALNLSKWYGQCQDVTKRITTPHGVGVIPYGVVAQTANPEGEYKIIYATVPFSGVDQIYAIKIKLFERNEAEKVRRIESGPMTIQIHQAE